MNNYAGYALIVWGEIFYIVKNAAKMMVMESEGRDLISEEKVSGKPVARKR
jgi:hypothetical protein